MCTMARLHTFVIATVLAAIPAFAAAQNPTGQTGGYFLRGKVTAFDGHQITVTPYMGGAPVTVPLLEGWTATVINPADKSIVAVGNTVNIVEVDQPDGVSWALFVDYLASRNGAALPAGVPQSTTAKGRSWSQVPGKDQFGAWGTLGTIVGVEQTDRGLLVKTEIPEGVRKTIVSPETVFVRNDRSPQSVVKVGENVAVILHKGADGKPTANRVLVGGKGTIPPM